MRTRIVLMIAFFVLCTIRHGKSKDGTTNNDFYDDAKTYDLPLKQTLIVDGEIEKKYEVELEKMPLRSVIVKETKLEKKGKNSFIGAYRYDGYSLYDILKNCSLKKKNSTEFGSCIDLYVTVENKEGQKVVFSWGEIYYPVNRHQIIIATKVMRIVPSKTKELWPLPKVAKIVAANDLITERNISEPIKITIHSFPRSYSGKKGMKPLIADTLKFQLKNWKDTSRSVVLDDSMKKLSYSTVFYGRGRGIHGISCFEGVPLREVIIPELKVSVENLQKMIFCLAAPDGYRCTFTYNEIVNRNDQSEVLLLELEKGQDGGRFKIFSAGDFFSDRAIKAINEIYGISINNIQK